MAKDLVLNIIMNASDKASKSFERVRQAAEGLGGQLAETQTALKAFGKQQKTLDKFKENGEKIRANSRALSENQNALKVLSAAIKQNGGATKAQVAEQKKLIDSSQRLGKQQQKLRTENHQLRSSLRQAGLDTTNLARAQAQLKAKTAAATAAADKQQKALSRLSKAQKDVRDAHSKALSLSMKGGMAMYAGRRALSGMAAVADVGIGFEKDFSRVVALQRLDKSNAADAVKIQAQRQQALDLGASTQYTSGQVAQGQGYLAMAGFNHNQILKAMPHTLNLATAAGMEGSLGDVSDIMSNIMSGFKLSAEEAQRAADVMAATFTSTNTNLAGLGETAAYAAPIMSAAGQSYESTMAMSGLLGNVGIQGSMAGTTLKNLATNLVNPKKAKALQDIGVKTVDNNGQLRQIPEILADMGKEINRLPNGEKLAFIEEIFGKIPLAGATELIDQLSSGKAAELFDKINNSKGVNDKTAAIMQDNAAGDIAGLKSAAEAISISLFDQQNGALRGLIQSGTEWLRIANQWIQDNPKLVSWIVKAAAALAVVATVLGGLLLATAPVLISMAAMKLAWVKLFTSIAAGTGVITKVVALLKGSFFTATAKTLLGLKSAAAALGSAFMSIGATITRSVLVTQNAIRSLAAFGKMWLTGLGRAVWGLLNVFRQFGMIAVRALLMIGRAFLMNPIGLAITAIVAVLYLLWRNWETVKNALIAGWQWIKTVFRDNPLIAAFTGPTGAIVGLIANFDRLKSAALSAWAAVRDSKLGQAVGSGISAVKSLAGYSRGGYTGAGGVEEAAGIVHKGEVVFSQRDVARFGGWRVVDMLRRGGIGAMQRLRHLSGRLISGGGQALAQARRIGGRLLEAPSAPNGAPVLAGAVPVPAAFHRSNSYQVSGGNQNITINIQGGSQSPQDIAREVARQLKAASEAAARRARSAFTDKD